MGRVFRFLVVLAVIAAGVAYVASPWFAFRQLSEAARAGDQDRLEALVDYQAVREGMKRQVDSAPTRLSREAAGIGFTPVEAAAKLGTLHGDHKIKKLTTPQALAGLIGGEASYSYLSPDRMRVSVAHDQGPAGFVLERRSLFGWKLVKLELPGKKIKPSAG